MFRPTRSSSGNAFIGRNFAQLYITFESEAAWLCKARISSFPLDITVQAHFIGLKLKFPNIKYLTQNFKYPIIETEYFSLKYWSYCMLIIDEPALADSRKFPLYEIFHK
jgi:hypothetical protein